MSGTRPSHAAAAWRRAFCLLLLACGLPVVSARAQTPGAGETRPNGFDLNAGLGMRLTSNPG
ncbi:MAG: hypothetical protein ACRD88_16825, partial [Terriglobia bacterium]